MRADGPPRADPPTLREEYPQARRWRREPSEPLGGHMDLYSGPMPPERDHLGRRLVLTLVVLLAFAGVTGIVVGMLVEIAILSLIGLI
jgi:hypothetical protein